MRRRLHGLRLSDFTAAVWFKPTSRGGLGKQTNSRWIAANVTVRLDGNIYHGARCGPICEWVIPGEAANCSISDHSWDDKFRTAISIGTTLELLLFLEDETCGPPRCIGLGRISQKHDPHGRW